MANAINIINSIVFGSAAIAVLFGWEPKPKAVAWAAFWAATSLSLDKIK